MYTRKAFIISLAFSVLLLSQISKADDRQSEETIDCATASEYIKDFSSQMQTKSEALVAINNPSNKLKPEFIKDYSAELSGEISDLSSTILFYKNVLRQGQCSQ